MVLPWVKYTHQGLSMGISIAPDMFQEKIIILLQDMVHVCVDMDDPVININYMYKNHMDILHENLKILEKSGM